MTVYQKGVREEKEKAQHMRQKGGDSEPEGQEKCLRLKERLCGKKQVGAAGLCSNESVRVDAGRAVLHG